MNKIIFSILLLSAIFSGCSNQEIEGSKNSTILEDNDNSYRIAVSLNKDYMGKMDEDLKQQTGLNSFSNIEFLKEATVDLNLNINNQQGNLIANANGTIKYNDESLEYSGEGILVKYTSPETNNTYFYTDINGINDSFDLMIIFSFEDNKVYIQTTSIVTLEDFEGYLIFGDPFMNKEHWDAISNQM